MHDVARMESYVRAPDVCGPWRRATAWGSTPTVGHLQDRNQLRRGARNRHERDGRVCERPDERRLRDPRGRQAADTCGVFLSISRSSDHSRRRAGQSRWNPDVRATTRTFDGRIYVFLLDDLHTAFTRTQAVRDAAKRFIQQNLGVNDLAAVVYTSGRQESGQELTGSRRLLMAAIDSSRGRSSRRQGRRSWPFTFDKPPSDAVLADERQRTHERGRHSRRQHIKDPEDA